MNVSLKRDFSHFPGHHVHHLLIGFYRKIQGGKSACHKWRAAVIC